MYLTYADYQNMGGTLDETTFNTFEFEAESLVDWYTFNRLRKFTDYPEALSKCMYQLITLTINQASIINPNGASASASNTQMIASQSNDGVSISYNTLSAKDAFDANHKLAQQTINRYLSSVVDSLGRKVLYRGIYSDE